jgi:DNA-binding CsgD family transcriptional regulator
MKRIASLLLLVLLFSLSVWARKDSLLDRGWSLLIRDQDSNAIVCFNEALNRAIDQKEEAGIANAFLYLGFASYGSSLHQGIHYAQEALKHFEMTDDVAGRGRCLQLMATIKAREGQWTEAEALAQEALLCFPNEQDTTLTKGLAWQLLGSAKEKKKQPDSAAFYFHQAYTFRLKQHDSLYLSASCIQEGRLAAQAGRIEVARSFFQQALDLASEADNIQSQVQALIALGRFAFYDEHQQEQGFKYVEQAITLSKPLNDKFFYLRCLETQKDFYQQRGDYQNAFAVNNAMLTLKDAMANYETERLTKNLELQFDVKETERKLLLIQKEHHISKLTNYLLAAAILFLCLLAFFIYSFYRKIHQQQKKLIATQQALLQATEEQKRLNEQQLKNEIEFKESQLSAITIQMLQKNQLLEEIQEKLQQQEGDLGAGIRKVIHKNQVQEQEWEDFNKSFERVNKNFYTRIKQQYPDISQNELKICALIKMNLSMKEMAGILNISPDSVKTARYRLRKKLQLQTEDNLHEFIMNL